MQCLTTFYSMQLCHSVERYWLLSKKRREHVVLRIHSKKFQEVCLFILYSSFANRYINNNISGAIDDLTIAVSIDENPITKNNLALVKNEMLNEEVNSSVAFSD